MESKEPPWDLIDKMTGKPKVITHNVYGAKENPLHRQVGGSHYKDFKIQPIEFIEANGLGFTEGCIVKYICRWRQKGGLQDIDKVIHYAEMLKKLHTKETQ